MRYVSGDENPSDSPISKEVSAEPATPNAVDRRPIVQVPLDANEYLLAWLRENVGNSQITIEATGTNEDYAFHVPFTLRAAKAESPQNRIHLVELELNPGPDNLVETAKSDQAIIDSLRGEGYHFALNGLFPKRKATDSSIAAAEGATIQVPLEANSYPDEWLLHNKGNRAITLYAEGSGITKESVGVYSPGRYFAIRKMISESPAGGINLVTLEVLPGPGPGYSNQPAKFDATKLQEKIDELRGKKFRFLLQGLVPLGEPLPAVATMADSVQAYPRPTPYPRNVATPPQTTGGLGMASDPPLVDVPREPNRTQNIYFAPRTIPATASPNFSIPNPAGQSVRWAPETPSAGTRPTSGSYSTPATGAAPALTTNAMPAGPTWSVGARPYPAPYANGLPPTAHVPSPWQPVPTAPGQSPTYQPMPPISIQAFSATFNPLTEQKKLKAIAKLKQAKTDEEKATAREELKRVLTEIFSADMKQRDKQAKEIESRIKKLRDQYEARENAQDEIIDLQLQLLEKQAAGLEFPAR
ncbi:hypothetical protein DSM3645_00770 [Blastopirellula marina DSM 3645]|uniref:Uncharacterized protein n=1 Tax=Blastopirellula marina DSM 3645 TaxID=314230 RepID=A3ZMM9_9BACT|nr:hypothetical protein DSM3645_00770 [Blastopirellula marina DSM 3645]